MAGKNASAVPPNATQLTVLVQTPIGAAVNNAEVEVLGQTKKTGLNSNRAVFVISDADYDAKVGAAASAAVLARKPHFGPPVAANSLVTPGDATGTVSLPKSQPASLTMVLQDAGLNRYTDEFDPIPIRALTQRQARDALLCLHRKGKIQLIPEPVFNHTSDPTCTTKCKVAHPLVGERIGMKPLVASAVTYLHIDNNIMPNDRTKVNTSAQDFALLDARNAVGLFRLGRGLNNTFGATAITHIGISGSDPATRNDCHGQGRAIDFGGVFGTDPTAGDYQLYIYYDWGLMQVFDLRDPETDLTKKKRLPKGQNWPPVSRKLMYRLDPLPPGGNDLAKRMFQEVYDFSTDQYNDKTATATQTDPPSVIGGGGRVMNPDYETSDPGGFGGREAHIGHLHMQVGETGTEAFPPIEQEP